MDPIVLNNVLGEQYVTVSRNMMGDQYVKGSGGSIGLKRMNFGKSVNGEHGYVD